MSADRYASLRNQYVPALELVEAGEVHADPSTTKSKTAEGYAEFKARLLKKQREEWNDSQRANWAGPCTRPLHTQHAAITSRPHTYDRYDRYEPLPTKCTGQRIYCGWYCTEPSCVGSLEVADLVNAITSNDLFEALRLARLAFGDDVRVRDVENLILGVHDARGAGNQ